MLTCFNVKNYIIFQILYIIVVPSMPRISQTHRFLQRPSFQQVQSALIGQLTQCIVLSVQAQEGNSRVTDSVMMLVCICSTQAAVKRISDRLYTPL